MTRILALAAAVAIAAGLTGCSAAHTAPAGAAPIPAPVAPAAKADALLVAVQGYSESLLSGDVLALTSYLHPDCAATADQKSLIAKVGAASEQARDAKLTVDTVEMSADSGRIGNWHVSANAPAKLKKRAQATAAEQAAGMPWRYVAGEWQFRPATCGGAS